MTGRSTTVLLAVLTYGRAMLLRLHVLYEHVLLRLHVMLLRITNKVPV